MDETSQVDGPASAPASLLQRLRGVSRLTQFVPTQVIDFDFDACHPQGLCRRGDLYWLSTVDMEHQRGYLLAFDRSGALVERVEVTDGVRYHPGGCDLAGGDLTSSRLVVPVAEYRPDSTAVIVAVDLDECISTELFGFDDHLGAVVELPTGGYIASTWGSRELVRFDADGEVVDRRPNSSHFVDFQDFQVIDADTIFCSGIADILTPIGLTQIGGIALLDVDTLTLTVESPVTTYSGTGRSITYNSVCIELVDDDLVLTAVPDDGRSQALVYRVT